MKEIYDWVPWFKELGKRIAEGGEQYLIDKAKTVPWKDDDSKSPLLKYGDDNIDPFSFFYTLASQSKSRGTRNRIYPGIVSAFELTVTLPLDLDDAFIFPIPPGMNTLFHKSGEGDPVLLWRLFRDAVAGLKTVKAGDFDQVLNLPNIATRKLTQALFLINPHEFIPADDQVNSLGFFDSTPGRIDLQQYASYIHRIREKFPGCELYEVNLFAYLQSKENMVNMSRCFQISTNAYDEREDHWEKFEPNNYVYTGGPGVKKKYPLKEPERGDVVLVRFRRYKGRGIGVVYRNDYQDEFDVSHRLHVLWLNKMHAKLPNPTAIIGFSHARKKTIDSFRGAREYKSTFELLDRLSTEENSRPDESVEDGTGDTEFPFNQILYGPPGTGKTWQTRDLSLEIVGEITNDKELNRKRFNELRFDSKSGMGRIAMITFHQSFAYEDFIEGIRPVLGGENTLAYEMRPGIFKLLVEAAKERQHERFVLIVDEINRGNIAKIFGDLITLIEDSRRTGRADETNVTLPYSGESFGVPGNLYVIGTMNTADRSIQLLDTALRRRFTFIEMMPNPEHEGICRDIDGIDCTKLLRAINERIAALLDREHQIGHTYLLNVDTIEKLSDAMQNGMFPLLQEYFFDDWAKIKAVLGRRNKFVTEDRVQDLWVGPDMPEEERVIYDRLPTDDPLWEDPDQYCMIYVKDAAGEAEET